MNLIYCFFIKNMVKIIPQITNTRKQSNTGDKTKFKFALEIIIRIEIALAE